MDALGFYQEQDWFSDPGTHAEELVLFPRDLTALHQAINNLVIHIWRLRRDYPRDWLGMARTRPHDVWTRPLRRVLDHARLLDSHPLHQPRPVSHRAIVDCRTFALLLCSILRLRGIPARPRCGFATYLEKGFWMDHWVCEYWDAKTGRWVIEDTDVQLHSVPSSRFYTGLRAWEISRKRPDMAGMFGYSKNERGIFAARLNTVRDFAALNGWISVSGDGWGLATIQEASLTAEDLALLNEITRLGDGNDTYTQRTALYQQCDTLRPGETIGHFDYLETQQVQAVNWQE